MNIKYAIGKNEMPASSTPHGRARKDDLAATAVEIRMNSPSIAATSSTSPYLSTTPPLHHSSIMHITFTTRIIAPTPHIGVSLLVEATAAQPKFNIQVRHELQDSATLLRLHGLGDDSLRRGKRSGNQILCRV